MFFNTCWRLIETWILPGSIIIPDCWKAYSKIRLILSEPYLLNKLSHGLVVSVTAAQTSNVSFEVVGSNLPVDIFIFKILTVKKPFLFTIWEELFQIFISWFLRKYGFQLAFMACSMIMLKGVGIVFQTVAFFYHDFSSTLRHHFECLAKPCSAGEQQVAFFHYKGGRIFMEHI